MNAPFDKFSFRISFSLSGISLLLSLLEYSEECSIFFYNVVVIVAALTAILATIAAIGAFVDAADAAPFAAAASSFAIVVSASADSAESIAFSASLISIIAIVAFIIGFLVFISSATFTTCKKIVLKYKENPEYFNQGFGKLKTGLSSSSNKMANKSGQFFLSLLPQKEQHEKWGDLIELYEYWKEDEKMNKASRYRKFITEYVGIVIGSVWQNIRVGAFKEIE